MLKTKKLIPNWGIFVIDLLIIVFSLVFAYNLRFNFHVQDYTYQKFIYIIPTVILIRAVSFYVFKTYAGYIRYTSTQDAIRIFSAISTGTLLIAFINIIAVQFDKHFIPFAIVFIDYVLTIFFMCGIRVGYRILFQSLRKTNKKRISNVIIYGAGEAGLLTKRAMERDNNVSYTIKAFIDDNPALNRKKLEGISIFHTDRYLEQLLEENEIDQLIIGIKNLPVSRVNEIVDRCLKYKVKAMKLPHPSKWINGELSINQIKSVKIDDLLQREPIQLDEEQIKRYVKGKKILVSGAAGSIGSEIVRQLLGYSPEKIILLDQAETPLYHMELELQQWMDERVVEFVLGNVSNRDRMDNLYRTFHPDVVFHAAAYKHVPMVENNPSEAILTNVLGSKIMADLAVKHKVEKFVLVSTDKAVNPTNVMGASKRVAEIYVQSLDEELKRTGIGKTRFITTRFGNVLGSNGSVITLFRQQIEAGGPVTITHPEVTRYFMTIPEACQLVLQAGAFGKGGEIFVFDMGESVRIADMAKKMIELSGLELGKDIRLKYTGLRAGEKLFEELLTNEENSLPTHHPKIMIGKVREYPFEVISKDIQELILLFDTQDNHSIVRKIKQIVPEFKSNNSVFSILDSEVDISSQSS